MSEFAQAASEDLPGAVRAHSFTAKLAHWGFTVVYIYALTKQLDEVEELEDLSLLQYEMIFACVFLVLLVVRFLYMRTTYKTALPADTPKNSIRLARFVHLAMYTSLSAIPISGLVIGGLYGAGIKSGGGMEAALLVHEIAVNTSYFLIIGHVAAAVYHRRKGDGVWNAMVPVWKEAVNENR